MRHISVVQHWPEKEACRKNGDGGHLRGMLCLMDEGGCLASTTRPEGRDEKGGVPGAASRRAEVHLRLRDIFCHFSIWQSCSNIETYDLLREEWPSSSGLRCHAPPHPAWPGGTSPGAVSSGLSPATGRFLFYPYPCHSSLPFSISGWGLGC